MIQEFSSKKRLDLYQSMLSEANSFEFPTPHSRTFYGLCKMMIKASGQTFSFLDSFPEIKNQRPNTLTDKEGFWFPLNEEGWNKRKMILKNAIRLIQTTHE